MNNKTIDRIQSAFESLLKNKKTLIKIMLVLVILLAALVMRIYESNKDDIEIGTAHNENATEVIYVDLGGAVVSPGVYEVGTETRLYEVINLAGGLMSNADTDAINRAEFVEDGEKIIIPVKYVPETETEIADGDIPDNSSSTNAGTSSSALININYATKDELKTLDGIGDAIADRIIEYRTGNRFKKKEDIKAVKGIGDAIFEKIKDCITV